MSAALEALPIFDAMVDGEHVEFVALSTDSSVDDVLEMTFVRLMVRLRATDTEAYEQVWELAELLEARGPALDALEG